MSQRARSCLIVGHVQTTEPRYAMTAVLTPREDLKRRSSSNLPSSVSPASCSQSNAMIKWITKAKEDRHMSTGSSPHRHEGGLNNGVDMTSYSSCYNKPTERKKSLVASQLAVWVAAAQHYEWASSPTCVLAGQSNYWSRASLRR